MSRFPIAFPFGLAAILSLGAASTPAAEEPDARFERLVRACDGGQASSCFVAGALAEDRGHESALELFRQNGDSGACNEAVNCVDWQPQMCVVRNGPSSCRPLTPFSAELLLDTASMPPAGEAMPLDRQWPFLWQRRVCKAKEPRWQERVVRLYGDRLDGGKPAESGTDEAVRLLTAQCRDGGAYACRCLGDVEHSMRSDPQNSHLPPEDAREKWRQACDLGSAVGCLQLSRSISLRDAANEKLQSLRFACERGLVEACASWLWYGQVVHGGSPVDPLLDSARLADLRWRDCRADVWRECNRLSYERRAGGLDLALAPRLEALLARLEAGCTAGHSHSCAELGIRYRGGYGVAVRHEEAFRFFARGCALERFGYACGALGRLMAEGEGAPQRHDWALFLLYQSCIGTESFCDDLGELLLAGASGKREPVAAARAFDRGCFRRHGPSCRKFGNLFARGEGVPRDLGRALRLWARAALLESPPWLEKSIRRIESLDEQVKRERHFGGNPP